VTRLAMNAALLGIPFDPHVLYTSTDRGYLLWLATLVGRVSEVRAKEGG
jgi:hypothetical protein